MNSKLALLAILLIGIASISGNYNAWILIWSEYDGFDLNSLFSFLFYLFVKPIRSVQKAGDSFAWPTKVAMWPDSASNISLAAISKKKVSVHFQVQNNLFFYCVWERNAISYAFRFVFALVGQAKTIAIPPNAKDILLIAEINIFIASWSTVVTKVADEPGQYCFKFSGTTLNPKIETDNCDV